MAIEGRERIGYVICLILTILLVGLHFAVAGTGHIWYNDNPDNDDNRKWFYTTNNAAAGTNYPNKNFNNFAAFIIIAAALTFIISIILLVALCTDRISCRTSHVLATLNLILEFAIAVVVSILASNSSNERQFYQDVQGRESDDLNGFYRVSVADAVITFVLQIIYLAVIYWGTLRQVEHPPVLVPVIVNNPPLTADRLH